MQSVTKTVAAIVLAGGIALVPASGFAATPAAQAKAGAKESKRSTANHATMGTVKSIDANNLVITRSGKDAGDMAFQLKASTRRSGTVAVGTMVSVRYQEEGSNNVATAITVQAAKQTAAAKTTPPVK